MKKAVCIIVLTLAMTTSAQARYDEKPVALDEETELLARLITAEAGADWCSDDLMYGVGSVVLNRMEHEAFPDTMQEVIYEKGQYQCVINHSIDNEPCERARQVAINLMENGSVLPDDVIFQAEFVQGDIYQKIQNTYFCSKKY